MTSTAFSAVSIAILLGLNLAAGLHILKLRQPARKVRARDNSYMSLPMSAFSNSDHPALLKHHDDVDPLTEAEIYVIYGRRDDARKVLDSGVRAGRINAEDVAKFWAEVETARVRKNEGGATRHEIRPT